MPNLRLIADDLTGALDSGCAFATQAEPVLIGLPWQPLPEGPRIAVSTESRDLDEAGAMSAVTEMLQRLALEGDSQTLWFKKIDSVMRGHPVAETVAAVRAGSFQHCVFAPAFPDMGRVTVEGRQYLLGSERRQVGPDFRAAFAAWGMTAAVPAFNGDGRVMAASGDQQVAVVDAETQETLVKRIASLQHGAPDRTLWVGTGGLAAALSGGRSLQATPPVRAVIVGTTHPVTLGQIDHAVTSGRTAPERDGPGEDLEQLQQKCVAVLRPELHRNAQRPVLIAPSLSSADASETSARLRDLVPEIRIGNPADTAFIVVGGDTLSKVLQSVGAKFLECFGEVSTGVPICRVVGGSWDGVTLVTKSGGFGRESLLTHLLTEAEG
ncbi:hypothetical protein LJR030_004581 [Rhizobium sp. LjRoot30]|uniref:four-carbon acid sugar kinase family protein n=1 Tax=Rhizobium sp. LjRoot30 TaxID=3342320 RepID=UPI003ECCCE7D